MMVNTTQPNGLPKYCLSSFLSNMMRLRMTVISLSLVVGRINGLSKRKYWKCVNSSDELSKFDTSIEIIFSLDVLLELVKMQR